MAAGPNHPMGMGPDRSPAPSASGKGSKASKGIVLGGIAVVTLLLIGYCSAQEDDYAEVNAECVDLDSQQPDGSYTVVDDDYCDDDDDGGSHYHGSYGAYRWYYGGVRSGTRIMHGTTVRPADVRIVSRQGTVIQRGGFGFRGGSGS